MSLTQYPMWVFRQGTAGGVEPRLVSDAAARAALGAGWTETPDGRPDGEGAGPPGAGPPGGSSASGSGGLPALSQDGLSPDGVGAARDARPPFGSRGSRGGGGGRMVGGSRRAGAAGRPPGGGPLSRRGAV